MGAFNDARLRAGAMLREWKEKRAEKRAPVKPDPASVTVPEWLIRAARFATWVATLSLMYFLWLYTLDIARDRAVDLHLTRVGMWTGEISFWFPYVVGFAIVAFGIPYVAKIAIPTFMSLDWRQNFWPKLWALVIALSVSLVVIAGTFAVQGDTLMERDRDGAVAVAQVEQANTILAAQIAAKEAELRSMMENRNAYLAQAASVGAAEWQRSYIEQTGVDDPQRDRIVRALGAARAADAIRAELADLRVRAASATTAEAVSSSVITERTTWIADALGWLEGVRAILLSLVMDIVALMMPWIALRLEQARARQLGMVEGVPLHAWMIEDHRGETLTPAKEAPLMSAREAAKAVFDRNGTREEAEAAARAAVSTKRRRYEDERGADITDYVERNGKMVAMPKRDLKTGRFKAQVSTLAGEAQVTIQGATFTTKGAPEDKAGDGGRKHIGMSAGPTDVAPVVAEGVGDGAEPSVDGAQDNQTTAPSEPAPEPEIDWAALTEPEQTEPEANGPNPAQSVEQDNAEQDDVEPRGLLPAA